MQPMRRASPITSPALACGRRDRAGRPGGCFSSIRGIDLVELPDARLAAALAAPFRSNIPEFRRQLARPKRATIAATGASCVVSCDLGCLMQIAGRLSRDGKKVEARHVAEVLADMIEAPRSAEERDEPWPALASNFKANAAKALADAELQRALLNVKRGFV